MATSPPSFWSRSAGVMPRSRAMAERLGAIRFCGRGGGREAMSYAAQAKAAQEWRGERATRGGHAEGACDRGEVRDQSSSAGGGRKGALQKKEVRSRIRMPHRIMQEYILEVLHSITS